MVHLIDKDALVAEIEDKIDKYTKRGEESDAKLDGRGMYWGGVISCLNEMHYYIYNLEVKEVDLDKEIEDYAYSLPHSAEGTSIYVSDAKSPIAREFGIRHDWSYDNVTLIAEHFYKLGLKAQKGK